jgi:hypothetical protein
MGISSEIRGGFEDGSRLEVIEILLDGKGNDDGARGMVR